MTYLININYFFRMSDQVQSNTEISGQNGIFTEKENMNFTLSQRSIDRIKHLRSLENDQDLMLRIAIYSGGCSGFKYHLAMTKEIEEGDMEIKCDEKSIAVLDEVTLEMLSGGMLDFVDEVSGSYFKIQNPNAGSSCGCGNSFS